MIGSILLVVDLIATGYHLVKDVRADIDEVYQQNKGLKRRHRMSGRERRAEYLKKAREKRAKEQDGGS